MALFLDSVDLEQIQLAMQLGIFAGVTTNPKLLAGLGSGERLDRLGEIARRIPGSLYLQVTPRSEAELERQALTLREVAPGRAVIKVPMGADGLRAVGRLREHGLPVCLTALFTVPQVFAAGCARAHAAAVYVGRITRAGGDGVAVAREGAAALRAAGLSTRLLAASIPDADTLQRLLAIPDIDLTIGSALLPALYDHPGTSAAIAEFEAAAASRRPSQPPT
ncbi:MAG TPA: transaldolase family protein [Myxococcota bacterium]|nr:transaldolase family protein [Myxococcota bacterium]HRY96866.1 transaldolase family protein [Myxococcota bacterium]HSA24486.1 transaldolase family protein [Myxococcota bacterium]